MNRSWNKLSWKQLSPRDRRIAIAGAAIVAGLLLWSLLWEPLSASRASLLRLPAMASEAASCSFFGSTVPRPGPIQSHMVSSARQR